MLRFGKFLIRVFLLVVFTVMVSVVFSLMSMSVEMMVFILFCTVLTFLNSDVIV